MNNDDLEYFECITLDQDADSFVDDDGIYRFNDGVWYEIFTTATSAEPVRIH